MSLSDTITDVGFGVGWGAIKRLPDPVVDRLFQAVADRAYRKGGPGVLQLRANLARVVPDDRVGELDELTQQNMRGYLRYWSEVFRLPSWDAARLRESFDLLDGLARLDDAVAAGGGAIMVSSHSGNWDLAAAWASERYGGLLTVAERLRPASLFDKFVSYRESLGMEVVPLGDADTLRVLMRGLREGKLVCLLADRDISGTGVVVDFFGEPASMPAGPAMLSLLTGAPIMPVHLWHAPEALQGRVGEALPQPTAGDRSARMLALTQVVADELAAGIREHPADWHVMQPLWLGDIAARSAS